MLRLTPTIEELLPNYEAKCTQPGCNSTFTNMGNYSMHLIRHHKMPKLKDDLPRLYHCPEEECPYNAIHEGGRHFKTIKYLRQHYQKVHLEKKHVCENCNKSFTTIGQLLSHTKKECGRKFVCKECNWEYETIEALLTHGKRKGHAVRDDKDRYVNVDEPTLSYARLESKPPPIKVKRQDKLTQTMRFPEKNDMLTVSVQTDPMEPITDTILLSDILIPTPTIDTEGLKAMDLHDLTDLEPLLRDTETQTEIPFNDSLISDVSGIFDQILSESSHMHTQTCDDFLSELGLADIETQTNWSGLTAVPKETQQQYSTTGTSTSFGYDDLLVSTETQTSFTQCLFDACVNADGDDNLYTQTQCTQTCAELLEGFFNSQDNDLINGFQSTYTQT